MEIIKYRTNINCQNCVRAVTGFLNEVKGVASWEVDTENPEKVLTVRGEKLDKGAIEGAVEEAGFDLSLLAEGPGD